MKKHLIAAAVAATVAVPAMAQSVEIYGIVDVGYSQLTTNNGNNNATSQATAQGFGQSGQSTSRLGFRVSEDLGGGLKAGGVLETEVGLTNADTLLRNNIRQAFISLASSSAGNFAIGRQYTPMHVQTASLDLTGANNVVGNLAYQGGATQYANPAASGAAPGDRTAAASAQTYTIRASNALTWATPKLGGFQPTLMYFKSGTESQSAGVLTNPAAQTGANSEGWGGSLDTDVAGFKVGAAWQNIKQTTANAANTTDSDVKSTEWLLGANYKVGVVTLGFIHDYRNTVNNRNNAAVPTNFNSITAGTLAANPTGANLKRTSNQGTLKADLSSNVNGWVSYGRGNVEYPGYSGDATAIQVGANYVLSKRSNLYGIYGQQKLGMANNVEAKDNQFAVGIRHQF